MATIIQSTSHLCKYFVIVELEFTNDVRPATGMEIHYDKIIAWCSKNISGKWHSSKMQQTINSRLGFNKNRIGTEDITGIAIFNFEDYNDKAHFILKWL